MIFQPIFHWWVLALLFVASLVLWTLGYRARNKKSRSLMWCVRLMALVLLFAMMLRPSGPGEGGVKGTSLVDIYLVVDNTISMRAEDYDSNKPRFDGVRRDVDEILARFTSARTALITFDNHPNFVTPLTSDTSAVRSELSVIRAPYSFDAGGSMVDAPLTLLTNELKRAATAEPDRSRIVLFFSDGENTSKGKMKSFETLRPYIAGGAVLGYGTPEGGKMRGDKIVGLDKSDALPEYITYIPSDSYERVEATSKINETTLRNIATQLQVPYVLRDQPRPITEVYDKMNASDIIEASSSRTSYTDIYWMGAPLLFAYFVLEAVYVGELLLQTRRIRERSEHGEN